MSRLSVIGYRLSANTEHRTPSTEHRGFTLIELVIAISVSTLIAAVLYFSLEGALESWQSTQDELLLQHVASSVMEELTEGPPDGYGLRDTLELVEASSSGITVVMPWTDDTHSASSGIFTYTLNKHIKPGTGQPIAEALLPGVKEYKVVPITLIDKGNSSDYPMVQVNVALAAGTNLRFTFHPDYRRDSDILATFRYDAFKKAVFIDDKDSKSRDISENHFGVKITDFRIRYFDNANIEIGEDGSISQDDLGRITGAEIAFKAESKNKNVRETVTFISLRNAPMHSGNLILTEGARLVIPDSNQVQAFYLTNLFGIDNDDTLTLRAHPESGKEWILNINFSRRDRSYTPLVESYSIEYPAGNVVSSANPRTPAELGLNLLSLGPSGLYDYDDDNIGDVVKLEGKVVLEVKRMDIGGASVFVKP